MTTPAIDRARAFSEARLDQLRVCIPALVPPEAAVVACGSYARREASAASDFDYFTIVARADAGPDQPWQLELKRAIAGIVKVEPAQDGAFGKVETCDRMVRNIGGQVDDNQKMTRRMLFLLEGAPLSGVSAARLVRRAILERYVRAGSGEPLALFLLNDMIRYYRTIAVDYEFKTTEGDRPKPWGLRNVKLMFSRKMLYAGGLFSVARATEQAAEARIATLERLLDLNPIDRLAEICGPAAIGPVLDTYDGFLAVMTDRSIRRRLEGLALDDRTDALFCDLKAAGERFTQQLLALFAATFDLAHPIHRAMLL